MAESIQHILERIRRPRVHITYDVEIGDAIQVKELPFVMGILADLYGMPENKPPRMADRKFIELDSENFNDVFASYTPRLVFTVDNKLPTGGERLPVELNFKALDDFGPLNVIKQIPLMNGMYNSRMLLNDLLGKLDGNDTLEEMLTQLLANKEMRDAVLAELDTVDPVKAEEKTTQPTGENN